MRDQELQFGGARSLVIGGHCIGRVISTWFRCFLENTWNHRRNGMRCPIWCKMLAICIRRSCVFQAAASSRAWICQTATSGRHHVEWPEPAGELESLAGRMTKRPHRILPTYGSVSLILSSAARISVRSRCRSSCGIGVQYESKQVVPLDQLGPFVQDALGPD